MKRNIVGEIEKAIQLFEYGFIPQYKDIKIGLIRICNINGSKILMDKNTLKLFQKQLHNIKLEYCVIRYNKEITLPIVIDESFIKPYIWNTAIERENRINKIFD